MLILADESFGGIEFSPEQIRAGYETMDCDCCWRRVHILSITTKDEPGRSQSHKDALKQMEIVYTGLFVAVLGNNGRNVEIFVPTLLQFVIFIVCSWEWAANETEYVKQLHVRLAAIEGWPQNSRIKLRDGLWRYISHGSARQSEVRSTYIHRTCQHSGVPEGARMSITRLRASDKDVLHLRFISLVHLGRWLPCQSDVIPDVITLNQLGSIAVEGQ